MSALAASCLRLVSEAKRSVRVWLRLEIWVASYGGAMRHRREGAVRKRSKIKLEFLRKTTHTRSPCDRTHHSHARCARSHRPNASSGPREWCFGRFASPRLVSAQAQVHFTNSSQVEVADEPIYAASSSDETHLWGRGTQQASLSARDIPRERIRLADSPCAQPRSRDGR